MDYVISLMHQLEITPSAYSAVLVLFALGIFAAYRVD